MKPSYKIVAVASLAILSALESMAQPLWVTGTPSVISTGPYSITINFGLDVPGTIYIIVFDFDNNAGLTSAFVKTSALLKPGGTIVATAVRQIGRGDAGKVIQMTLNVKSPGQIHTIYIVAENARRIIQPFPVRLTATTLPCPEANAGTGGEECGRTFQLNATAGSGTGTWTRVSGPGNASFSPNNHTPDATVTVTTFGSYTFRWTVTFGLCKSSSDIIINFFPAPRPDAGTGGDECDLDFILNASPVGGNGRWSMTGGTGSAVFLPDENDPGATVIASEYGTKVFTWTESIGSCSGSAEVKVNFYRQPVANAGTGGNNCGLEVFLHAVPSTGTGRWSRVSGPGGAIFSPDAGSPDVRVTVSAYGTYVFLWTEVNGPCTSSETVTVNFFEYLSANAGNGGDECDRDFRLNAVPGTGTGTWSKAGGPGTAIFSPDPYHFDALVTVSEYGDYDFAWTEVNFNCSSTDIIRVVFHAPPSVNAGQDVAICRGSSTKLMASGSGSFLWNPSGPLDNPSAQAPVATPAETTFFTVMLTDQWNCVNSDQVRVEVRDRPVPDAGPDQLVNYVFETYLGADKLEIFETGDWKVLSGTGEFQDKNKNDTKVTGLSVGVNRFVWSVNNGVCAISSDTVNIIVSEMHLPTMITPNMDGNNDSFFIKGIETLGKTVFSVFNRWGALVYNDNEYSNDWDGKDLNGNPLPEDTYFYLLKPETIHMISGYIVIRR